MNSTLKFSLFALIFAGLFTSCKSTEDVVAASESIDSPQEEMVSEAPIEEVSATDQVADTNERTFFASIFRSACFGRCPTYKMTIYSDGFVELEGIRHIDLIGKFTTNITEAQVHNFRIRANRTGFMDMEESYDSAITDLPSATTTIVLNGVTKSVYRRHGYPKSILQFEVLFDELLKSERWKSVSSTNE